MSSLAANGVEINRDLWIKDGEEADKTSSKITAESIIRAVIGVGIDDEDRKATFLGDAESCSSNGAYECARTIYTHLLKLYPNKKSIWMRWAVMILHCMFSEKNTRTNTKSRLILLCNLTLRSVALAQLLFVFRLLGCWDFVLLH